MATKHTEPPEQSIRERAYHLWEQHGRPSGRDLEFWSRAAAMLATVKPGTAKPGTAKRGEPSASKPDASRPAAKRRTKSAA